MQTELKPNDVAVIMRPNITDGNWDGSFEIMVTGFGPITMSKDDMDSMIGVATVLAAVVPFMEQSEENAALLYNFTKEFYGEEVMDFDYNPDYNSFEDDDENNFTINTKTVGGMH